MYKLCDHNELLKVKKDYLSSRATVLLWQTVTLFASNIYLLYVSLDSLCVKCHPKWQCWCKSSSIECLHCADFYSWISYHQICCHPLIKPHLLKIKCKNESISPLGSVMTPPWGSTRLHEQHMLELREIKVAAVTRRKSLQGLNFFYPFLSTLSKCYHSHGKLNVSPVIYLL